MKTSLEIAIVGAGMAGVRAAQLLQSAGHRVRIFEKSTGAGGRMSTRRSSAGDANLAFDHGAQYFTARDARFIAWLAPWLESGLVQPWHGKIVAIAPDGALLEKQDTLRLVAQPAQNALLRAAAQGCSVQLNCEIVALTQQGRSWTLQARSDEQFPGFDYVLLCLPAAQAAQLCPADAGAQRFAQSCQMQPCWAVMVAFDSPILAPFDGAFVNHGPLSWVARNSSKPGRDTLKDAWVLHASAAYSAANLDQSPEWVQAQLLAAFAQSVGVLPPVHFLSCHRWRYASGALLAPTACFFDAQSGIGMAGDWCAGGKVEGAFLSGTALANCVLNLHGSGIAR
jgi:renalase